MLAAGTVYRNDRRYNGVVLHVVAAESAGRPEVKATGASIPLLALNWTGRSNSSEADFPESSAARSESGSPVIGVRKSSGAPVGPTGPMGVLDLAAGLERFHAQAAGIALDIEAFRADQAVWLGAMGALGYPRNKRAFRMLATRVSWSMVAACGSSQELESLLLQAAGLGTRPTGTHSTLTRISGLSGSPPEWVRPWGRPPTHRRYASGAISVLAPIWADTGGIAETCARVVARAGNHNALSRMFRPAELIGDSAIVVMGSARASETVVNVLLPTVFALAAGSGHSSMGLKNNVLALYDAHPKLAENSVTREAKVALGVDYEVPKIASARDQQGLIILYREMFRSGIRPHQRRLPGV